MELTQIRYFLEAADNKQRKKLTHHPAGADAGNPSAGGRFGSSAFCCERTEHHADRVRKISSEKTDSADGAA